MIYHDQVSSSGRMRTFLVFQRAVFVSENRSLACLNSTRSWVNCLLSASSSAILILLFIMRLKSDRMSR